MILPQAYRRLLPPGVSLLVNIIQNTTIAHSANHGIARGWLGGGPDFSASNTFEDIAGCDQTLPRDPDNGCPDGDGCG